MIVTFISQCQKKALNRTRRVLDSFANRIGQNTWQTVITMEGLLAVKKLLKKTATKNTAVSCHRIRGRLGTELVWVVGKKGVFNEEGLVALHHSTNNKIHSDWENNWHFLPVVKALVALAALFHDWGKASVCFQKKLQSKKILIDPLRHEWVSCLLLSQFINQDDEKEDQAWLSRLASADINEKLLKDKLTQLSDKKNPKPLANMPPVAKMVLWLILTHHRLPLPSDENTRNHLRCSSIMVDKLFNDYIKASWGYANQTEIDINQCFSFDDGLLSDCQPWLKQIKKWANKLLEYINNQQYQAILSLDGPTSIGRVVLFYSRLSLMLGDHNYSSKSKEQSKALASWGTALWANTIQQDNNSKDGKTEKASLQCKQTLDNHLLGVTQTALQIAQRLPFFATKMATVDKLKKLKQKSQGRFAWQDKAVANIVKWREETKTNSESFAFFTINIASTGCGKTLANAKMMQALSANGDSLRYILALGLRTLTLQTGDVYKNNIGLDETELAVLVGSTAVLQLHQMEQTKDNEKSWEQKQALQQQSLGSESQESLLEDEEQINYGEMPADCDDFLTTIFKNSNKNRRFLYAPVLVCTIDYLMRATETIRGGRYILPSLRLMSSDLVIDEVDDFDVDDLVAIGRLVHLAGMLGRKVMLSSATIPEDLAYGYFDAYQQGWQLFAKSRGLSHDMGCGWVDEFNTTIHTIKGQDKTANLTQFKALHQQFIDKRIIKLKKQPVKRIGSIIQVDQNKVPDIKASDHFFKTIQQAIIDKHQQHYQVAKNHGQKKVSFGIVRMANIKPCVALSRFLLKAEFIDDIDIKIMTYHSRQVLLMRHYQEAYLDKILKRHNDQQIFSDQRISEILNQSNNKQVIFVVVATPVCEIGRDHDFDWAIVEPSSFRSIIQLAGRVLRHRDQYPKQANIGLLQYNLKGLTKKEKPKDPVFCHPGFEGKKDLLNSHDLSQLFDRKILQSINAIPRIKKNESLKHQDNLIDLGHYVIEKKLINRDNQGPETLAGYIDQAWWLTALPQQLTPFRKTITKDVPLYLLPDEASKWSKKLQFHFCEKDDKGDFLPCHGAYGIELKGEVNNPDRLWLPRDYQTMLQQKIDHDEQMTEAFTKIEQACQQWGQITLTFYGDPSRKRWHYWPDLGLVDVY